VATSSLIIVLEKLEGVENYSLKVADILLEEINGINFKSIQRQDLEDNMVNWNFLTFNKACSDIVKKYNSHYSSEIYYEHSNVDKPSKHNFYFDVGFILSDDLIVEKVSVKETSKFYRLFDFQGLKHRLLRTNHFYPKDQGGIELTKNSQGYVVLTQKYKIIWSVKNPSNISFTEEEIIFPMGKAAIISSNDKRETLYLLSLLNSRISWFIFNLFLKSEGEKDFLIPISAIKIYFKIPKIDKTKELIKDKIIDLTEDLLAIDKESESSGNSVNEAKINEYSRQIDRLIYGLYGLTKEEIGIVENLNNG
jgi:hypothetical protein